MDIKTVRQLYGVEAARGLPLDETITARTFAALAETERGWSELEDLPGPGDTALTIPPLPHITLTGGGEEGGEPPALRGGASRADFEITGVLGEGGMGRVLRARQRSLGREVAIKLVRRDTEADASNALLREAVIMGFLEHPSIVPVHALGCDEAGRPVLVMKRIDGVAWSDLAQDHAHPAWAKLPSGHQDRLLSHLEIMMFVCNAIHFAHSRGIIHRDIKPANVMVGDFGEVYVVDWGLAIRTPGASTEPARAEAARPPGPRGVRPLVGTPRFMAPEMLTGDPRRVDVRTDVYLLGATLHAVLTGKPRHAGATLVEVLVSAHASRPYPYDGEIPAELAEICNRATSVHPGDRYPTVLAFREALADYLHHRSSIALSARTAERLAELRARLAAGPHGSDADARDVHRLTTECHFGFAEALREWPENAAARRGLAACIEIMIEQEIGLGNVGRARALVAELPEPRPDLEAKLEALAADLAKKREREARLEQLERDLDPSVAASPRRRFGLLIAAMACSIFTWTLWRGAHVPDHREIIVVGFVVTATLLTGIAVARRRLFESAINRRLIAVLFTWNAVSLVNRLLSAWASTPIGATLATDLLLLALALVMGGLLVLPRLALLSPIALLGAAVSVHNPLASLPTFAAIALSTTAIVGWFWRRERDAPDDSAAPRPAPPPPSGGSRPRGSR